MKRERDKERNNTEKQMRNKINNMEQIERERERREKLSSMARSVFFGNKVFIYLNFPHFDKYLEK